MTTASTVLVTDKKFIDTSTSTQKPAVERRTSDIIIEETMPDGSARPVMRLSGGQLLDEPLLGSSLDSARAALEKESPSRLTVHFTDALHIWCDQNHNFSVQMHQMHFH